MEDYEMTSKDFLNTLSAEELSLENLIPTIEKAFNTGYSLGSKYAFHTCGVTIEGKPL